jgi:hypothetical protein
MIDPNLKTRLDDAERLAGAGPIEWGWYLQAERHYSKAGLDPMPEWHGNHYRSFAASGATEFVMGKGTRGGGSTNWVAWELSQAVSCEKIAHESVELLLPVMAYTVAQANGRSLNFQTRLSALGYERIQTRPRGGAKMKDGVLEDDGAKPRVGPMQFWATLPSSTGVNTIEFRDYHGRLLTIRTACASKAGASEYTAFDVFGDEVAQWGKNKTQTGEKAERAGDVLALLRTRLKGQRPGKGYFISQPLPNTEFYEICRAGSNKYRYVCTLGERGVENDRRARAWLREECAREARGHGASATFYRRLMNDTRLVRDLDPSSPWNPAWAILPVGKGPGDVGPEAAMRECCSLALTDVGREDGLDPLEQLWWGFGGHPSAAVIGRWIDGPSADACLAMSEVEL